jgi:hypothetical protein
LSEHQRLYSAGTRVEENKFYCPDVGTVLIVSATGGVEEREELINVTTSGGADYW